MRIVGLMSGSSLDGLDLALIKFDDKYQRFPNWTFEYTVTLEYPDELQKALMVADAMSAREFIVLHNRYGAWIGKQIQEIISAKDLKVDFIGSHGHTVFHEPDLHFGFQLGEISQVAAHAGISTYGDFRIQNLALGGQGAPLAPLADMYLFPEYSAFLNLGGISNLSILDRENERWESWDIGICNQGLNYICRNNKPNFDDGGAIARNGKIQAALLEDMNAWEYYQHKPPKSLSNQAVQQHFFTLLDQDVHAQEDQLATLTHHIAARIIDAFASYARPLKVLCTGGGAHNHYLMECLNANQQQITFVVPDKTLVDFKEALLIAFATYRRHFQKPIFARNTQKAFPEALGGYASLVNGLG